MARHHIMGHGRLRQVVYGVMRLFARTRAPTKRYARSPGRQDHAGPTAAGDLDILDEPGPQTLVEIFKDLISETPTPGKFFMLRKGGPVALCKTGVTGKALDKVVAGAGSNGSHRLALLRLMTQPDTWNWDLYSRDKFTSSWPSCTGVEGRNLGTAWLPRHKKASQSIMVGKIPARNIDLDGNKIGPGARHGLIWIPPLDENLLKNRVVSVGDGKWSDGSSVLNPPPELMSLLTAA